MSSRRTLFVLCLVAAASLATPAGAATVTINFDVDPDGAPIANAADVATAYSRLGVVFDRLDGLGTPPFSCDDGSVFARTSAEAVSSPNVVSICETATFPSFNDSDGAVRGTLERDAEEICVAVVADGSSGRARLAILDDQDNVLDSVQSAEGADETICIRGSAIRYFRFAGNGRFAFFDDLRITYGPNRIDFDTTADGTPIADGTVVDALFENEGVVFEYAGSQGGCANGSVYANDDLPGSFGSPPNAVSVCGAGQFSDFAESSQGRVVARFPRRVSLACVQALPSGASGRAVIRAFDVNDVLLAETISAQGSFESRICVSDPLIRSVEFAGYQGSEARFDDLDFDFGAASIDFDFDTSDAPIAGGTTINQTYQSAGVLFSGLRVGPQACGSADEVYANDDTTGDFSSSPNQVSLCDTGFSDFSENGDGLVQASFPVDARSVCIEVRATNADDYAVLRSFDANAQLLGEVESSDGATETLCVSGGSIRTVRFAGAGAKFARFDDLDVDFVPEPGAGALAVVALGALAALRRRPRAGRAPRRT